MAKVAVRTAPSRESARRALIEAYVAQGDLAAAVDEYDEYQELLRSSVGGPVGHGLDGLLPHRPRVARAARPPHDAPLGRAAARWRAGRAQRQAARGGRRRPRLPALSRTS